MTPAIVFGLALFACLLTQVPDKYKPAWSHRLKSWQALVGLVAVIVAILIVVNPEFYALGILGDSAFFDLLVLAISFQLQLLGSRAWCLAAAGLVKTLRGLSLRYCLMFWGWVAFVSPFVSAIQKAVHRMSS